MHSQDDGQFHDALKTMFSYWAIETDGLLRLRTMLRKDPDRVIRGHYHKQDSGCLLWWTDHDITTRRIRRAFFAEPEVLKASDIVVAAWDSGYLTASQVLAAVDQCIRARQEANRAEDSRLATIHRGLLAATRRVLGLS